MNEIEHALRQLVPGTDPLAISRVLRRLLPPELAREAAELFELRRRAVGKFPNPGAGLFTRKGLEQATRAPIARARAERIARLAPPSAAAPGTSGASAALCHDATCGLGADAIALAAAGLRVVASDLDLRTAVCARANLAAAGHPQWALVADALQAPLSASILLVDPDRRNTGRRSLEPESWSPTLTETLRLAARYEGACIKLAPSIEAADLHAALPPDLPYTLEWISHSRELCEVALWTGCLAGVPSVDVGIHEVLALEVGPQATTGRISGRPVEVVSLPPSGVSGISWLCDPDPAVIRSGLLGLLSLELGLAPIAPRLAWLGGREQPDSPLLRSWRVLDQTSADPKRVRAMLARHDIGPVRVMKRGHPDRPEALERRFRGRGSRRGLVAVARLEQGHAAFLLEDAPGEGPGLVGDKGFEPPTSSL